MLLLEAVSVTPNAEYTSNSNYNNAEPLLPQTSSRPPAPGLGDRNVVEEPLLY